MTTLIPAGYFDPGIRVMIVVTVGGMPNVLMDGIVTRHELAPSNEAGQSSFTITGEDLSVLMDVVEMPFMRWPAMPAPARVLAMVAKYAVFGIVPVVIPPIFMDVPIPTQEIPPRAMVTGLGKVNTLLAHFSTGLGGSSRDRRHKSNSNPVKQPLLARAAFLRHRPRA